MCIWVREHRRHLLYDLEIGVMGADEMVVYYFFASYYRLLSLYLIICSKIIFAIILRFFTAVLDIW